MLVATHAPHADMLAAIIFMAILTTIIGQAGGSSSQRAEQL
jgi:hypothetical protein